MLALPGVLQRLRRDSLHDVGRRHDVVEAAADGGAQVGARGALLGEAVPRRVAGSSGAVHAKVVRRRLEGGRPLDLDEAWVAVQQPLQFRIDPVAEDAQGRILLPPSLEGGGDDRRGGAAGGRGVQQVPPDPAAVLHRRHHHRRLLLMLLLLFLELDPPDEALELPDLLPLLLPAR